MNITLIGMPGAGKSTIGIALAKELGCTFMDSDKEIEKIYNKKLSEIVDEVGDDAFLEIEGNYLATLKMKDTVLATGGSAIYEENGMKNLKEISKVIYLRAPVQSISSRVGSMHDRGVIMHGHSTVEEVFEERYMLYEKYADIVFDVSSNDFTPYVKDLIQQLQ